MNAEVLAGETRLSGNGVANRRSIWRVVRKIWIALGLTFLIAFTSWSLLAYRASPDARAALQSDSLVRVELDSGTWAFVPIRSDSISPVAFLFFPGALVNPVAYAPLMRAAALEGHAAFIVTLPRRGAFGGAEDPRVRLRTTRLLQRARTCWVLGGHSRGGAVASQMAFERPDSWSGLILIGTSHPRDVDLSHLTIPATKIVGTRDGLASRPEVEQNRSKLPASTRWVWIEGGNHSQFGWYGFQPGDRRAAIPAARQRLEMIQATIAALRSASADSACRGSRLAS